MYEDMTYEKLINRMMDRVIKQHPNFDRREGSMIFNALASSAFEHAIAYTEIERSNKESFVQTASREYKIVGCRDMGINTTLFEARAGSFKGEFDVEVEIGARVNCDLYNYTVTEYLGKNGSYFTYSMDCETTGTAPNEVRGDLTFITDIPTGITYAMLTDCLVEGENELTDEEINVIFEEYMNNDESDGNTDQYKKWCNEYNGIGNYKIFPLWDGNNTVKVSILSASNGVASDELVTEFQNYIDPGVTGMGDGAAPIGAFVTVTTAATKPINVTATVSLKSGYNDTNILTTALDNYLKSISYQKSQVAYMRIGAELLSVDGVELVNNLLINGGTSDINLGDEEIPILGTTTWTVV